MNDYTIIYTIIDNKTDVIVIATNGRNARARRSFKLTFSPSPTIEAVSNQVVNVDIPSITFSDIGI